MDENRPWITLFDRESRKFTTREMHFAAVSSTDTETSVRHVAARLSVDQAETNVLFFRITKSAAEFESSTTPMSANNSLLAVLEPSLRDRLQEDIFDFVASASF